MNIINSIGVFIDMRKFGVRDGEWKEDTLTHGEGGCGVVDWTPRP
jgi:hypothetical protein